MHARENVKVGWLFGFIWWMIIIGATLFCLRLFS